LITGCLPSMFNFTGSFQLLSLTNQWKPPSIQNRLTSSGVVTAWKVEGLYISLSQAVYSQWFVPSEKFSKNSPEDSTSRADSVSTTLMIQVWGYFFSFFHNTSLQAANLIFCEFYILNYYWFCCMWYIIMGMFEPLIKIIHWYIILSLLVGINGIMLNISY